MTLNNLFLILKGSSRSGNRGHSGRPGKRGGSGPGLTMGALSEFATSPILNDLLSGKRVYNGDTHLIFTQLVKELGFDSKPKLVDNLDEHISKGDLELHRGVSGKNPEEASKYVEEFKSGAFLIGRGVYGNGTYSAFGPKGKETAKGYTGLGGPAGLIRMALDKKAKIISVDQIQSKLESLSNESNRRADKMVEDAFVQHEAGNTKKAKELLEQSGQLRMGGNDLYKAMNGDSSIAAAAMGYDAVSVPGVDFMVILNRGVIKVES